MSRIKITYNGLKYSLGSVPQTYSEALNKIQAILKTTNCTNIYYLDPAGEKVVVNSDESYSEAISMHNISEFEVQCHKETRKIQKDQEFQVRKCIERLKSIFTIVIGGKVVGVGILTNNRLALTSAKTLPNLDVTKSAFAIFESSGFQVNFDVKSLWLTINDLTLTCFESPYCLISLKPISLKNFIIPKPTNPIFTLHKPIKKNLKSSVKRLEIREVIGNRVFYDSINPCGASGSPVFDANWDFIALQITECDCKNIAVNFWMIWEAFSSIRVENDLLKKFLEDIKPIKPREEVEELDEVACVCDGLEVAFGVDGTRENLIRFDKEKRETEYFRINEKVTEGFSLCQLPFGVCLSGGVQNQKKAWIYYFKDVLRCFQFEIPNKFHAHCSTFLFPSIYLMCGKSDTSLQNATYTFSIITKSWTKSYNLIEKRYNASVSQCFSKIYIFGGIGEETDHHTIEMLNDMGWEKCDFHLPSGLFGLKILNHSSGVYICGGMCEKVKTNEKIFKLEFGEFYWKEMDATMPLGIFNNDSWVCIGNQFYFYNANGELVVFSDDLDVIKVYNKPLIEIN